MPKGTVQYKWTLMGLTKQEGSRQVNCHPLLFYSIPAPLPINYINFSQMTACLNSIAHRMKSKCISLALKALHDLAVTTSPMLFFTTNIH